MIYNYYLVDADGGIKEKYRLEENDSHIAFKGLVKEWEGEIEEPKYSHSKEEWYARRPNIAPLKEQKKAQLSRECTQEILSGFTHKVEGAPYHFSYDKEAQTNLAERWQLFQNHMIESIKVTAHKGDEDVRLTLNKQQFNELYLASVTHKENCISRYRDAFIPLINNAVTIEQLQEIRWDNEIIYPEEPIVLVTGDDTLDSQLQETKEVTKEVSQTVDLNGMAMMEFMSIIFAEGF